MSDLTPIINARTAKPNLHQRIMAVGPLATGKTTQFRTLPGKKFAYIFAPNSLQSLEGADIDCVSFIPDITDIDLAVKTLKKGVADTSRRKLEPKTYVNWEEDFVARTDSGFFDDYDVLLIDDWTTFEEIIMDRVQHLNQRLGKHPEQADYTASMNTARNIVRTLTSLELTLYLIAHTEIQRDEQQGRSYGQLVCTGKNRTRIPLRFSQIFGFDVDTIKGETKYVVRTRPSRMLPICRTTIRGLEEVVDVTIDWKKEEVGQGLGGVLIKAGLMHG